jgi:mannose-1-phosphate guanylyltransferase
MNMDAVMMAGGRGVRLRPFTDYRPKPMIPFLNRPVMEYLVEKLSDAGIDRIFVLLGYLPDMVEEHFGNGEKFGINIEYIRGNGPFGTAGAVKRAVKYIDDPFLVVSADIVTEISIRKFLKFHADKGDKVSIALSELENPYQYGIALVDDEQKIYKFLEKPKNKSQVFSNLVNTGIYIIEPSIFDHVPPKTNFDFSKNLFPLLLKRSEPIHGYRFSEYWADIGTPKRYLEATRDALDGKIDMDKISGELELFEGNELMVGDNCSVDDDIEVDGFAVLGKNVKVESGSRLSDTVIWPNTDIGKDVSIKESIVGEHVRIFPDVRVAKGAMIPDKHWVLY